MTSKIIIVSGCDDGYVPLLLDMLKSLAGVRDKYHFGILDLGLSRTSKDEILKIIPHAEIKIPDWYIDLPDKYKDVFAYDIASRPFMNEIFPGYDGYLHVDADIWFLDPSAVDDYITAGEATGCAVVYEYFPYSYPYFRTYKKYFKLRTKSVMVRRFQIYFGDEVAIRYGNCPTLNGGLVYIKADNPLWNLWQDSMRNLDYDEVMKRYHLCDQTCLQYCILHNDLPVQLLSRHHNWLMPSYDSPKEIPIFDTDKKILRDFIYPHAPIKVLHIYVGNMNSEFSIPTTDGKILKTKLTRTEFLKTVDKF